MRIITGTARGTKLAVPRGMTVRPTGDRVKESIFNILSGRIAGSVLLDLFAGVGGLGLEALSRGAAQAVFVDNSSRSVSFIQQNAVRTRLADKAVICKLDVYRALANDFKGQKFDLIFCDPPYQMGHVSAVLRCLDTSGPLAEDAVVVIEHSRHEAADDQDELKVFRNRQFGDTMVTFLKRE